MSVIEKLFGTVEEEQAPNVDVSAEIAGQPEGVAPEAVVESKGASAEIAGPDKEQTEQVPEQPQTDTPPEETPPVVNEWDRFRELSEGLVDSEDKFREVLSKAKSADDLQREKEELLSNQFKPANDYVATLNKLYASGANQDQLKAFMKLNEYGNIDDMTPVEILKMKRVLIDGYAEDVADYKINKEFNLSEIEENSVDGKDSIEYKAALSDMKAAADQAKKELTSYKSDLTNTERIISETERKFLEQEAFKAEHAKKVEQIAPQLAKELPTKFKLANQEWSIPEEMQKDVPSLVAEYLNNNVSEINSDTKESLSQFIKGIALLTHGDKIFSDALNKARSEITEEIMNKYENKGGLPEDLENKDPLSSSQPVSKFDLVRSILGRE